MELKLLALLVAGLCTYTHASPTGEDIELKLLSRLLQASNEVEQEVVQKREEKSDPLENLLRTLEKRTLGCYCQKAGGMNMQNSESQKKCIFDTIKQQGRSCGTAKSWCCGGPAPMQKKSDLLENLLLRMLEKRTL